MRSPIHSCSRSSFSSQTPRTKAIYFTQVVSVEPQIWNACVEVSIAELHDDLLRRGIIRRARDLTGDAIENFLRFGYVLRCLDEAFAINA